MTALRAKENGQGIWRYLSGSKEAMKAQKAAFYLATGQFSQVVGLYYAHKYFGAKAKADVHHWNCNSK